MVGRPRHPVNLNNRLCNDSHRHQQQQSFDELSTTNFPTRGERNITKKLEKECSYNFILAFIKPLVYVVDDVFYIPAEIGPLIILQTSTS